MNIFSAVLDAAQTILLGWAAGCIVALAGLVRALVKGEEF